jgi:lipoprotein NlpI
MAFLGRGIAFSDKGDNDRAIADFNEAIRLDPKSAMAFDNRGSAYHDKGDNDRAIADYNEAIRLDPERAKAFNHRGYAYSDKGDNDRAIADYNEAIRLNPNSSLAYFARGRSYLFAGSVEKALADVNQASAHAPENAYLALWVDIVSRRNNLPGRLAQTSSRIDMTVWPAPVIRLFMDQMTPAAVLAAADDPDATKKKGQVCEANFYSGELSLTKGLKDEATRLFRLAASDCPHSFNEWDAANAELKALGVVP